MRGARVLTRPLHVVLALVALALPAIADDAQTISYRVEFPHRKNHYVEVTATPKRQQRKRVGKN